MQWHATRRIHRDKTREVLSLPSLNVTIGSIHPGSFVLLQLPDLI